jgi:hemoglobin-like flavoprotein
MGSTTSASYAMYVTGGIYSTASIVAYSDKRKKENIVTIDNALDKVCQMRGVYYNKIDDDKKVRQVGVIAQEMQEVLPEAVSYAEDVDEYGVAYGNIAGILIEAIKDLKAEIKELKAEVDELKKAK